MERVLSSSSSSSSKSRTKVLPIQLLEITPTIDTEKTHEDTICLPVISDVADTPFQQHPNQLQDGWLPITQSRKGSSWTASFHLLSSGIGIQSLALPLAFVSLGWFWGILCLWLIYAWQLYTMWILIQLHESSSGARYSRFLHLSVVAFGEKLGKFISIFPVMYLSGGTCVSFIIYGGGTVKLFFLVMSGNGPEEEVFTGAECFLVFMALAILLAQFLPNLNSVYRVSLVGSIAALASCTMIWIVSIVKERPAGVVHDPSESATSDIARFRHIMNALGVIALAFRGHNLVLEIQGTMPTSPTRPSREYMWRGMMISYLLIAMCLFPLAIGGYWAYGNMMPTNGGMVTALSMFHNQNTSKFIMGTIYLIMVIHYLSAFQIYAMPVLDNWERIYTTKNNKPCPRWVGSACKVLFGGLTYFIAVGFPFLIRVGGFIGAIALPLTLAYPCFMWIAIKKPHPKSLMWCINMVLGSLGVVMSVVLATAALWSLVADGLEANFFKP